MVIEGPGVQQLYSQCGSRMNDHGMKIAFFKCAFLSLIGWLYSCRQIERWRFFCDERNWFFESSYVTSEIVYMADSEEVLINYFWQGCHPLSRIFTSTRKWLSRRVDWIVSDDFMNSSFWHSRIPWFRRISDNPNPALKKLTISFLALEGKGSYSFPLH